MASNTAATPHTAYNVAWGRAFADATVLVPADYEGTIVRDGYVVYDCYTNATHQTCLAHLCRRTVEMIESDRELLMVQLHAYAACEDETIRECVRTRYAQLVRHVLELSDATPEQVDQFMSVGMWLNVQAAMGVGDLDGRCDWIRADTAVDEMPVKSGPVSGDEESLGPAQR